MSKDCHDHCCGKSCGMEVVLTVKDIMDHPRVDLWDRICELKGINVFAVNEGQMNYNDKISFTLSEAQDLGILGG